VKTSREEWLIDRIDLALEVPADDDEMLGLLAQFENGPLADLARWPEVSASALEQLTPPST
jgi:hypothetical protein